MSPDSAAAQAAWREAAARLVQALEAAADDELRLLLLKRLARQFGELGYPGFLKLVTIVAESAHDTAQRRLADAFALGLRRLDVPSGQLTSWGGGNVWPAVQGDIPAHRLGAAYFVNAAPKRQLGPIEYLTVWFCQHTQRPYLSEAGYRDNLARLVGLMNRSPAARELYPRKIEADLATASEGAYTRLTRERLRVLAQAWIEAQPPEAVAAAACGCAAATSFERQRLRL